MTETCPECGSKMKKENPPTSAMGEKMWGRGLDTYYCDNSRCPRFGR